MCNRTLQNQPGTGIVLHIILFCFFFAAAHGNNIYIMLVKYCQTLSYFHVKF